MKLPQIAAALLAAAAPAAAQECAPDVAMKRMLATQFGETPAFTGALDAAQSPPVILFSNGDTGTWTLVALPSRGIACIVASGTNWLPAGPTY